MPHEKRRLLNLRRWRFFGLYDIALWSYLAPVKHQACPIFCLYFDN